MPRGRKPKEVPQEAIQPNAEPVASPIESNPIPVGSFNGKTKTLTVERKSDSNIPRATKYPSVRGGICEFCGVLDRNLPAHLQFTICEHYKGVELKCSYCPAGSDWNDIVSHRQFQIFEYPEGSGSLVVVCDDIRCTDKHIKRFQKGRSI